MHYSIDACPHRQAWRRQQGREATVIIAAAMAMNVDVTTLEPMAEEATTQVAQIQCNIWPSQHSTPPGKMSKRTSLKNAKFHCEQCPPRLLCGKAEQNVLDQQT
jgi:hypothetical protein